MVQNKQGKHIIAQSRERYALSKPISRRCVLTNGYIQTGQEGQIQPNKQVVPKTNKHKPTDSTKHGKT